MQNNLCSTNLRGISSMLPRFARILWYYRVDMYPMTTNHLSHHRVPIDQHGLNKSEVATWIFHIKRIIRFIFSKYFNWLVTFMLFFLNQESWWIFRTCDFKWSRFGYTFFLNRNQLFGFFRLVKRVNICYIFIRANRNVICSFNFFMRCVNVCRTLIWHRFERCSCENLCNQLKAVWQRFCLHIRLTYTFAIFDFCFSSFRRRYIC